MIELAWNSPSSARVFIVGSKTQTDLIYLKNIKKKNALNFDFNDYFSKNMPDDLKLTIFLFHVFFAYVIDSDVGRNIKLKTLPLCNFMNNFSTSNQNICFGSESRTAAQLQHPSIWLSQ